VLFFYFVPDTSRDTSRENDLVMINTADMIGGKLITVFSESISSVSGDKPIVSYDIHGRKEEVL
jgi:hypothetical protein